MTSEAIEKLTKGEMPTSKTEINVGGQTVLLDNTRLYFNESSIHTFMENLGLWYDHFSQRLAEAETLLAKKDWEYDVVYAQCFESAKEEGCSDKLADARAKQSDEVRQAKLDMISTKYKVTLLKQHLRAWDKAHENAQSRGHTIRKEMDKLKTDIRANVEEIVGSG